MNRFLFLLKDFIKKMWVRCCLFCLFALFAVVGGPYLDPFVPDKLKEVISPEALESILKILASSMLAVTTFSLSIMVQAFSAAATTASPRANKLLMENSTAQNALATFIGSFLFSIVGIISISAKVYSEDIVIVLFVFTLITIVIIVVMLLRWIDQLSRLGRVSETIDIVEDALRSSIHNRAKQPFLKAKPLDPEKFDASKLTEVVCKEVGYVQYIDVEKLNSIAEEHEAKIYIDLNPGRFLDSVTPMAYIDKNIDDKEKVRIVDAFVIGDSRTFNQDPRYGFVVLNEIALKAISPAVNDPGTAIDVISVYIRSVRYWVDSFGIDSDDEGSDHKQKDCDEIKYDRVFIASIGEKDILEDMYSALIADAASNRHICIHIRKSLHSIAQFGNHKIVDAAKYWQDRLKEACSDAMSKNDCQLLFDKEV